MRSQNPDKPSAFPCTTDPIPLPPAPPTTPGVPAGCTPSHQTLFIPNITTDTGLSPPFNSLFTFFGQFFDHGVDQTVKSGSTVFVPLKADDPLITLGPDGRPNTGDEVSPQNAFMVLTRAQNQPGPDGVLGDRPPTTNQTQPCSSLNVPAGCNESVDDVQDATNTDSPWVDQSQTYTSHPSHQVFLRQYVAGTGTPGVNNPAAVATGKLLGGLPAGQTYPGSPDGTGGISTWAAVKKQAHDLLGLQLVDMDVLNVPMLATDPYGKFLPGPHGLPQYVTTTGLVEGNLANPVPVPANVLHFDTPFLTDIAHNADPSRAGQQRRRRPGSLPDAGHGHHDPDRLHAAAGGHLRRRVARTRTSPVVTAAATRTSRSRPSTPCSTPSTTVSSTTSRTSSRRTRHRPASRLSRSGRPLASKARTAPAATATVSGCSRRLAS